MSITDYKLKYLIEADASSARRELDQFYGKVDGLGSRLGSSFSSAMPAIGAASAALAGAASTVAGAGVALFNITKTAAEFGSTIYDASQKTGLGATAISSLQAAAEQSGSSLEAVTKGIAKFAKNYQGTSQDLQSELGKVFKQIADAKPGFEQLTLAQKNFGKGGADLIPMIRSFDGNLDGLIARMTELGITIDDKAAYEADQFGDQMDILNAQLAGVGRTIGTALMPEFTRMASDMGTFLTQNKSAIQDWGEYTANVLRGISALWREATAEAKRYMGGRSDTEDRSGGVGGMLLSSIFPPALIAGMLAGKGAAQPQQYGPYAWEMSPGGASPSSTSGASGAGKAIKKPFRPSSQAQALLDAANELGVSALDLATIIGFETAGTYSPKKTNQYGYKGLIQFGASEQKKYGVTSGQSFETQVTTSVVQFLRDRFASVGRSTAGASLLDLYRTVLGGNPNASLTRTDANGTSPLSGVRKMLRDHRPQALARFFGGSEANAKGGEWGKDYAGFANEAEKELAEQKKIDAEMLAEAQKTLDEWIREQQTASTERNAIRSAEADQALEILKGQLDQGLISEVEYTDRVGQLKIDMLEAEKAEIEDQISTRENIQRLQILDLQIETARLEKENAITAELKKQEDLFKSQGRDAAMAGLGGLRSQGAARNKNFDGFGALREAFDERGRSGMVAGVDAVTNAFSQLGQAVGAAVEAFVLYGSAGASVRQVTAQILASIAQQAAIQAIYELAQGLAVLALAYFGVPNAGPSAATHFAAAAMYGVIAGGAAITGRMVAGDSFKQGSGGYAQGTGAPGSPGSSGGQYAANMTPYSRASADAYLSGRRYDSQYRLTLAIENFNAKVDAAKPGDVFIRGMKASRGAVGQQVVADIRTNARTGTDLGRSLGIR